MGSLRDLMGKMDAEFVESDEVMRQECEELTPTQRRIYEGVIAGTFLDTQGAMQYVDVRDYCTAAGMAHRHVAAMFEQAADQIDRIQAERDAEREAVQVLTDLGYEPDYPPGVGPHVDGAMDPGPIS